MRSTRLYKSTKKTIQESVDYFGYAREEYALLDNKRKVSRSDYDDGSTIIWGRPTRLRGRNVELRTRFLTPYNLVLAPVNSPINHRDFREPLSQLLNAILAGTATVDDLAKEILRLPKREAERR